VVAGAGWGRNEPRTPFTKWGWRHLGASRSRSQITPLDGISEWLEAGLRPPYLPGNSHLSLFLAEFTGSGVQFAELSVLASE